MTTINGNSNGERLLSFIHDGYSRSAFIAGIPRLYPDVRFTFRPMLSQARAVVSDRIAKSDPSKGETLAATAIVAHVSDWDVTDHEGKTVDVSTANVLRLQPRLMAKLFSIVVGNLPPDEDPGASPKTNADNAEREFAAALAGKTLEEHDAKN